MYDSILNRTVFILGNGQSTSRLYPKQSVEIEPLVTGSSHGGTVALT